MIKFDKNRYWIMLLIVIALIAFLGYQDTVGANMWGLIGGWTGDAYVTAMPVYMQQFWFFSFMLAAMVALVYYLFRKDRSEAVAIFASFTVLVLAGLEDIFFYIFKGIPLDADMFWLYSSPMMGGIAKFMGLSTVTPTSLIVSVILGFIIVYFMFKKFKKYKW